MEKVVVHGENASRRGAARNSYACTDWVDVEAAQGSELREMGCKVFYWAGIVNGHSEVCHESVGERILQVRESEGRPACGQAGKDRRWLFLLQWDWRDHTPRRAKRGQ